MEKTLNSDLHSQIPIDIQSCVQELGAAARAYLGQPIGDIHCDQWTEAVAQQIDSIQIPPGVRVYKALWPGINDPHMWIEFVLESHEEGPPIVIIWDDTRQKDPRGDMVLTKKTIPPNQLVWPGYHRQGVERIQIFPDFSE